MAFVSELRDPGAAAAAVDADDITGRFTLGPLLGRGANACVYRAFDRKLACDVALKNFEDLRGESLFRLKSEFRILRGISHPNLAQLYHLVVRADEAFFTMEMLEGAVDVVRYVRGDLAANAALDGPTLRRLRTSFAQLFDGLLALHAADLLHRDLKPSNVLVVPGGRTVLLDFGMATHGGTAGVANPGEFAGTPAYAAPEVFTGEGSSRASDAYSAGVLLLEALTGTRPYVAERAATLAGLRHRAAAGVLPGEFLTLVTGLLSDDPGERLGVAAARALLERDTSALPRPAVRSDTPFVGRRAELDWLRERMAEVRDGATVLGVVHGESGIGKSELVRHFLDEEMERGTLVLSGFCRPRESVPYNALDGPTDQLSDHFLRSGEVPELSADATEALLRLFPVLERVPGLVARRRAAPSLSPREAARRALFALAHLLRQLSTARPLILWVDDGQWGDRDSATALQEILALGVPRMLLLVTCRPGRDEGIVRALWDNAPAAASLELGPLDRIEARELVRRLLGERGSAPLLDSIAERSKGSPFVLQELSDQFDSEWAGMDIARGTVARVEAVAAGAEAVARIVALAGSGLRETEILALSGATADSLLYRMQELRLLRPGASRAAGLEIYHDRIRDAVLDSIPAGERKTLHGRIAEVVRQRSDPDAAMLVEHYLGSGARDEAGHWAVVAAEEAERGFAFARSAELYRTALELRGRGADDWALAARRGQALAFAGERIEGGRILFAAAAASEERRADKTDVVRLRADAARELLCGGDVDGGLDALRRMVRTAGFFYPRTPRLALAQLLVLRAGLALRGLRFRERDESAIPADRLERIDACWTGIIGLNSFDAIRSGAFQARHTFLALAAGEPKRAVRALTLEAAFRAVEGGDAGRRKAWSLLSRVDALAERLDDPRTTAFAHLCAAVAHYFAAQWPAAFERASAGEEVFARVHGSGWERTMCRMYRVWSDAWRGDTESFRRQQAEALEAAAASEDWLAGVVAASGHANLVWLFDDEPALGRRRAVEAIGRFPEIGFQSPHYADLIAQTRIDLYEGLAWPAWERIHAAWPRLRSAQLLRLQLFRVELRHLRACAALAAARCRRAPPPALRRWSPERLRQIAAAEERRLRREDLTVASGLAATVRAGLCESPAQARRELTDAAELFTSGGARLYAALASAAAAGELTAAAAEPFAVARPDLVARFLLPSHVSE